MDPGYGKQGLLWGMDRGRGGGSWGGGERYAVASFSSSDTVGIHMVLIQAGSTSEAEKCWISLCCMWLTAGWKKSSPRSTVQCFTSFSNSAVCLSPFPSAANWVQHNRGKCWSTLLHDPGLRRHAWLSCAEPKWLPEREREKQRPGIKHCTLFLPQGCFSMFFWSVSLCICVFYSPFSVCRDTFWWQLLGEGRVRLLPLFSVCFPETPAGSGEKLDIGVRELLVLHPAHLFMF